MLLNDLGLSKTFKAQHPCKAEEKINTAEKVGKWRYNYSKITVKFA